MSNVRWALPLAGCLAATSALAQNEGELNSLEGLLGENVVSSASRTAQTAADAPATTWSITGEELRTYGIQSVVEALEWLGHGISAFSIDHNSGVGFASRGFTDIAGTHFAVLLDGNQGVGTLLTSRASLGFSLPIELVDRIEIIIGPGSVMYGNSAMVGVANIILKHANTLPPLGLTVQGLLASPADLRGDLSWGGYGGRLAAYGGTRFQLAGDELELVWHLTVRGDREPRLSRNTTFTPDLFDMPPSAFEVETGINRDLRTKLIARASWGHWVFLASQGLNLSSGWNAVPTGTPDSRASEPDSLLDAQWASSIGRRGHLTLRGYGTFARSYTFAPRRVASYVTPCPDALTPCADSVQIDSGRVALEPLFSFDWSNDGAHVTQLGAQFITDLSVFTTTVNTVDGRTTQPGTSLVAPIPSGAVFAQHVWKGAVGTLNGGLRADVGVLGSALSPRLALARSFWLDGTLKLIGTMAFRTPTLSERFLAVPQLLQANPNLRPEHVYSVELNLAQRLGHHNLQLSVYGEYWSGLISLGGVHLDDGSLIGQFGNIRNIWSAGISGSWRGTTGPFDWALSASYQPGRMQLPADVSSWSDDQLGELGIVRPAVNAFRTSALGSTWLPSPGSSDFVTIGHITYSLGTGLPKLGLAAVLLSPRTRFTYLTVDALYDPRVQGFALTLPWAVEARATVSYLSPKGWSWRLTADARSNNELVSGLTNGSTLAPLPQGGIYAQGDRRPWVTISGELGYSF